MDWFKLVFGGVGLIKEIVDLAFHREILFCHLPCKLASIGAALTFRRGSATTSTVLHKCSTLAHVLMLRAYIGTCHEIMNCMMRHFVGQLFPMLEGPSHGTLTG
jgi:hypothetical protein